MINSFSFEAIGTHWTLQVFDELPIPEKEVINCIKRFENTYSRFRDDSLVAQIAQKTGQFELPFDAKKLFDIYQKLYRLSDGAVTPLIGKVLVEAGYDKNYSLTPQKNRTPTPLWSDVMDYTFPKLITKQPIQLDFGAAGKGYLIDLVAKVLVNYKIKNFCVEAGGDMVHHTTVEKNLRVGLENPYQTSHVIGLVEIQNAAICASAGNRRAWGEFNHIMDPRSLKSPDGIAGVWVIAKDAITADALTTGLYFVKSEILQANFDFEYLKLLSDMTIEKSPGFQVELF